MIFKIIEKGAPFLYEYEEHTLAIWAKVISIYLK